MKKLKVILFKGLPASGKTTAAKKLQEKYPYTYKRINKDELRMMLNNGAFSRESEKMILDIRDIMILYFLTKGYNIIIDDTNLAPIHEKRIKEALFAKLKKGEVKIIIKDLTKEVSLNTCIKRDSKRDKPIGAAVIRKMYKDYIK